MAMSAAIGLRRWLSKGAAAAEAEFAKRIRDLPKVLPSTNIKHDVSNSWGIELLNEGRKALKLHCLDVCPMLGRIVMLKTMNRTVVWKLGLLSIWPLLGCPG
ncbi:hypothetical protein Droror1_Dr00023947 [Drosera rotundifolia]